MDVSQLVDRLARHPRLELACLPTPVHPLRRLSAELGGPEIWIKRDDLTGLAGGGNKTRKLEFVVGDAVEEGADTPTSCGGASCSSWRSTNPAAGQASRFSELRHTGVKLSPRRPAGVRTRLAVARRFVAVS